jgi:hypothetical protein
MLEMLRLDPAEIQERSKRLRTIMSRYRWENLITEYDAAISTAIRK